MLSIVLLCAVLPLVYSQCMTIPQGPGVKFCRDKTDNTWHPVGSSWRNSECMDCVCSTNSMSCCSAMGKPVNYPDTCEVKYDYSTCTFEVFEKKLCSHSAVGK